jgi:WD40 repeat protein
LVKIWSKHDGRLLASLKGHDKKISDMDVNFENTLISTGSYDKNVRIWNLKTTESTFLLQGHSNEVHSVEVTQSNRFKAKNILKILTIDFILVFSILSWNQTLVGFLL